MRPKDQVKLRIIAPLQKPPPPKFGDHRPRKSVYNVFYLRCNFMRTKRKKKKKTRERGSYDSVVGGPLS